ncbi:hypothetical protein RchiOBHm_Chr2g0107051 [Rosa chinensis]|uniref:Uncharacterized protein n=1 Tax=Rosa chinensis TaxID=74649 RepID=A0A2P6RNV0_ROSCH|nr:hypothetical protein RchiOBHm_Chr2g0107051 [Rosa chinensis]
MKVCPFSYYVLIFSIGFVSSQISLPSVLLRTIDRSRSFFPAWQPPPQNHRSISLRASLFPASSSKPSVSIEIDLSRGFKTQFGRSSATRLKPKANH